MHNIVGSRSRACIPLGRSTLVTVPVTCTYRYAHMHMCDAHMHMCDAHVGFFACGAELPLVPLKLLPNLVNPLLTIRYRRIVPRPASARRVVRFLIPIDGARCVLLVHIYASGAFLSPNPQCFTRVIGSFEACTIVVCTFVPGSSTFS